MARLKMHWPAEVVSHTA